VKRFAKLLLRHRLIRCSVPAHPLDAPTQAAERMNTQHERIVELEADVARLKWQVAQLMDYARREDAAKKAAYDEMMKAVRAKTLAVPYDNDPTR